jgi:SAM-dependent methyltransferase
MLAAIAGLKMPPVERWRVLEIGCGDASNLFPLAFDYPEGSFVGVDRAHEVIDDGRMFAAQSQLANLELHVADLLDWKPEGTFDYIITHGLYSWVPQEIRQKILQICQSALKPWGIAYISYNALPGCHFRRFAWDMLRFHVRRQTDPALRIAGVRALAQQILNQPVEDPMQPALRNEMENVLKRDPAALYHDDLAETNEPFYLKDFVAQADHYGLQYLGDADPQRDDIRELPLQAEDWLESRQYGDFLARRRFRETILCRKEIPLDRAIVLDRFQDLFAASRVKCVEPEKDGQQTFSLPRGNNLTTNHPYARNLLCHLASIWPGSMQIAEFSAEGHPSEVIADLLMRLLQAGAIELRVHPIKMAATVSNRPCASALAQAQVAAGFQMITNQRHINVELKDEIIRTLILILDGTRDRQAVVRALLEAGMDAAIIENGLEASLAGLHRLCLLTD